MVPSSAAKDEAAERSDTICSSATSFVLASPTIAPSSSELDPAPSASSSSKSDCSSWVRLAASRASAIEAGAPSSCESKERRSRKAARSAGFKAALGPSPGVLRSSLATSASKATISRDAASAPRASANGSSSPTRSSRASAVAASSRSTFPLARASSTPCKTAGSERSSAAASVPSSRAKPDRTRKEPTSTGTAMSGAIATRGCRARDRDRTEVLCVSELKSHSSRIYRSTRKLAHRSSSTPSARV